MVISRPSSNRLFPGWGLTKVSHTLDIHVDQLIVNLVVIIKIENLVILWKKTEKLFIIVIASNGPLKVLF